MKIAFVVEYYYPLRNDATGKICKEICETIAACHDITVFSMSDSYCLPYKEKSVTIITKRNLKNVYRPQFLYLYKRLRGVKRILFLVQCLISKIETKFGGPRSKTAGFDRFVKNQLVAGKFDVVVFCCGNYGILQTIDPEILQLYKGRLFLYALDPFDEKKLSLGKTNLEKILKSFSCLILPPAFLANHPEFRKISNSVSANFPMVLHQLRKKTNNVDRLRACFFGSFYKVRNNESACDILNELGGDLDIFFYTNCSPSLSKKYPNIFFRDFIFEQALENAENDTDFFINIDNDQQHSDYVPSKTFEYLGWRKPIITFFSNSASYTLKEMSKYDLSLPINTNENKEITKQKIRDFIAQNKGKISQIDLPSVYSENRVDKICYLLNGLFENCVSDISKNHSKPSKTNNT